jgi:hypothetical protein
MSRIALWLSVLLIFVFATLAAIKLSRRGLRRRYTSDRRQWWAG